MTQWNEWLYQHTLPMTMAGVSGGDLKQRVTRIMGASSAARLTRSSRILLGLAVAVVVCAPVAAGVLTLRSVSAQTAAPGAPPNIAFETASIRPAHLTPGCFSSLPPGGTQYALTCVTLRNMIEIAYGTGYIEGGGSALDTYYDVRATTPAGTPWTTDSVRPMMRQLLADRFHLALHAGQREISGYGLVTAKGGPKIRAVAPEPNAGQKAGAPSPDFITRNHVQGRSRPMDGVADLLAAAIHAPVVNHTGLPGVFNVDLSYAPDNSTDPNLPSFFTAVEEQLGLALKPEKVTVTTQVIDHVDSTPTAN